MTFTYYYKTRDGIRHEAEISSPSRDEAFAALREQGIRPIKVVAHNSSDRSIGSKRMLVAVGGALSIAVLLAGGFAWMAAKQGHRGIWVGVAKRSGGRTAPATPLERQRIPGDRVRLEQSRTNLFAHPAEVYLSYFAEPGRKFSVAMPTPEILADFSQALKDPILISSDEWTEHIDLKRIVTGMKREMHAYISAGGAVQDYIDELIKRQKMETAYRTKAEQRLNELLNKNSLADAYDYWLKANASMQSMGIAVIPLPSALREYQLSIDLEE